MWGHRCCNTNQGVSQPDVLTFLCRKDRRTGYTVGLLLWQIMLLGYYCCCWDIITKYTVRILLYDKIYCWDIIKWLNFYFRINLYLYFYHKSLWLWIESRCSNLCNVSVLVGFSFMVGIQSFLKTEHQWFLYNKWMKRQVLHMWSHRWECIVICNIPRFKFNCIVCNECKKMYWKEDYPK